MKNILIFLFGVFVSSLWWAGIILSPGFLILAIPISGLLILVFAQYLLDNWNKLD